MRGKRALLAGTAAMLAAWIQVAAAAAAAPSIAEVQQELAGGTSCRSLTAATLERIHTAEAGDELNAVVETNPRALRIADGIDAQLAAGDSEGPLRCVPVLIKDNMQTADRMHTTVGSIVMRGFRASEDAFVVARLRRAGAVIVGKTNMDEWAHGAAGYSSNGGQTHNGRNPLRNPGGSSGGSAAAIAAGLVPLATGSDTGGSIQIPASYNGVVGLRSTRGLISRAGIAPYASFTDVPGPLTGSVDDLARTLGTLTGVDPADPATEVSRGHFLRDYTGFLDPNALAGARIGVVDRAFKLPISPAGIDTRAAFEEALLDMTGAGAVVAGDLPPLESGRSGWRMIFRVVGRQFRVQLDRWLPAAGAPVRSLAQVIERSSRPGARKKVRILETLRSDQQAKPPHGPGYRNAKRRAGLLRRATLRYMRRHDLDAIAFSATGCPAPPLPGVVDDSYRCDGAEMPLEFGDNPGNIVPLLSPATGLPVITVPGPPMPGNQRLGLSLMGAPWSEGELISLGYAFEQRLAAAP